MRWDGDGWDPREKGRWKSDDSKDLDRLLTF